MRAGVAIAGTLLLAACTETPQGEPAPAVESSPAPMAEPATQPEVAASWLGKWTGPEGTYLEIAVVGGTYTVTISNLDGPRSFPATSGSASLHFERDGVAEEIRATDGSGTGMKWLMTKTNCLVVRTGEGFCRD